MEGAPLELLFMHELSLDESAIAVTVFILDGFGKSGQLAYLQSTSPLIGYLTADYFYLSAWCRYCSGMHHYIMKYLVKTQDFRVLYDL